jgi:hypothetical protein
MEKATSKYMMEKKLDAFLSTLSEEEVSTLISSLKAGYYDDILSEVWSANQISSYRKMQKTGDYFRGIAGGGALMGMIASRVTKGNPFATIGAAAGGALLGYGLTKLSRTLRGVDKEDQIIQKAADKEKTDNEKAAKKAETDKSSAPKPNEKSDAKPSKDKPKGTAVKPRGGKCPGGHKMIFGLCRPCKGCD